MSRVRLQAVVEMPILVEYDTEDYPEYDDIQNSAEEAIRQEMMSIAPGSWNLVNFEILSNS